MMTISWSDPGKSTTGIQDEILQKLPWPQLPPALQVGVICTEPKQGDTIPLRVKVDIFPLLRLIRP